MLGVNARGSQALILLLLLVLFLLLLNPLVPDFVARAAMALAAEVLSKWSVSLTSLTCKCCDTGHPWNWNWSPSLLWFCGFAKELELLRLSHFLRASAATRARGNGWSTPSAPFKGKITLLNSVQPGTDWAKKTCKNEILDTSWHALNCTTFASRRTVGNPKLNL